MDKLNVRYGLIFNEMDALATDVGYKYFLSPTNKKIADFRIVTAVVDRINFLDKIQVDKDFKMNGYVM